MKFRLAIFLILIAAVSRLFPHPPNFTPLAAIGLFGVAHLERRWLAWAVPFAALFVSDLLLNNVLYSQYYEGFVWFTSGWIYLSFALVLAVGWGLLRRRRISALRVTGASLTASAVFFLVSNFSVWLGGGMYPKTGAGLMACYTAGLPFFSNTLLGDLAFSGILFGGYAWMLRSKLATA
ncbi:MAG: hypothetical protein IPH12_07825 [Saprospirales bacterium]|nr:hypothetical protein [Saprospirales bacterium]MBK8920747.1 hypothetical protein [Saprospirales bacterium]